MRIKPAPLHLPREGWLPKTSPTDPVDHYHRSLLGFVMRLRLRWVLRTLPTETIDRLLDIGCGSGTFFYELTRRARATFGLDLHPNLGLVKRRLVNDGLNPALVQADATCLPYRSESFDAAVIVSVLEFVPDPAACVREALRVLRPGGKLVLVTPRRLAWADALYRALSGIDPEGDFRGGRDGVQSMLARQFTTARRLTRPAWLPSTVAPYEVVIISREKEEP